MRAIKIKHASRPKVSNTNFKEYSQYYNLFYQDKDYLAESEYILKQIKMFTKIRASSLLDLGSGIGTHGKLIAKQGFKVTGIELSPEMVTEANKVAHKGFHSLVGDIRSFDFKQIFDVITALFHVVSYLNTNSDLDKMFSSVTNHLEKNGLFIFDAWYSPAVFAMRPDVRVKRLKSGNLEITRIAEPEEIPNENLVKVNYTIFVKDLDKGYSKDFSEVHPMRHYSLPEILFFANKHGFEMIHSEEFLTGNSPSEKTWGVVFVLRKK